MSSATRVPVQGEPNDELAKVEAELAEWVAGKRSWCDQHHGLLNQFELTAKADDAQIRLLMTRRDALRTEAQGEPNDDREALARALYIASDDFAFADRQAKAWDAPGPHGRQRWYRYADAVVAAGFSRATVPDAATAALERVRVIHSEDEVNARYLPDCCADECDHDACPERPVKVCGKCWEDAETANSYYGEEGIKDNVLFPCATRAALDGVPEPEWEEVVQYGNLTSLGFIQETRGRNYAMHKRIVRFGPVLPAQGESDE